jgi:hypothetical protein
MRLDESITPEERLHEVAAILASAVLRLHLRGALDAAPAPKNPSDSSPDCLELSPKSVVSAKTEQQSFHPFGPNRISLFPVRRPGLIRLP